MFRQKERKSKEVEMQNYSTILSLPIEVLVHIFAMVEPKDLMSLSLCCKRIEKILCYNDAWQISWQRYIVYRFPKVSPQPLHPSKS